MTTVRCLLAKTLIALLAMTQTSCGLFKPKNENAEVVDLQALSAKPLSPEESEELLGEVGKNFVYGEGVGCSMLSIGTIALFPPYAALLLGNAALSLNGYEELWPSDLLPEQDRAEWKSAYSGLCSVPGRISADLAGEDFRSEELARQRLEKFLKDRQSERSQSKSQERNQLAPRIPAIRDAARLNGGRIG